jgi:hypothetical protein
MLGYDATRSSWACARACDAGLSVRAKIIVKPAFLMNRIVVILVMSGSDPGGLPTVVTG